ncbi:unnamed protein product [Caenorhabditis brenneri]
MSNSKPVSNMDHTNDGLYGEIENIEKVVNLDENKRKNIVDLKNKIEDAKDPESKESKCPFLTDQNERKPEAHPDEKLRDNVRDQVNVMNFEQLAAVHNFLQANDIERLDRYSK